MKTYCSCKNEGTRDISVRVLNVSVWFVSGKPDTLITDFDYAVCRACRGCIEFVDAAVASNSRTAPRGKWMHAVILTEDKRGLALKRATENDTPVAQA